MAKNDQRKIVCTACNYENEIERVYCHNCGEKLDRSLLPKVDEGKPVNDLAKAGRKARRMMNPNRFAWLRAIRTFVLIELFAATVAAVFLAVQPPEDVPPAKSPDILPEKMKMVGDEWAGMMGTRNTATVVFKEFDINYYLRNTVKGGEGPLGTKFERAFVLLKPGLVTAATQRSLWGLQVYNTVTFKPVLAGGKWTADVTELKIGRLAIPPNIAKLTKLDTLINGALTKVFEKEIKQLERVDRIEVGDKVISFATKPAQ
jgi:hypothetical protein